MTVSFARFGSAFRDRDVPHLLLIVLLVAPPFALIGRWGVEGNPDAIASALPAWQVAQGGSLDLAESGFSAEGADRTWLVLTEDGAILSNRAPGIIAAAIPAYAALGSPAFSNAPATAVAFVSTTAALLAAWAVLKPLVGRHFATASVLILAFGTTTWWVSASELWPHGPGQLMAALALLALGRRAYYSTGGWFAIAITLRPITGLFAAVTGMAESWRQRDWRPVSRIGLMSACGMVAVLIYNRAVFQNWSIRGGYSAAFTTEALERFSALAYLNNLHEMLTGLPNGVLVTSPIIGVSLLGSVRARHVVPSWAWSAALAAAVYLAVHAALNRASGGSIYFYRYPLEAIVMALPALAVGARALWSRHRWRIVLVTAAVISVLLQLLHVFILSCWITFPVVPVCLLR